MAVALDPHEIDDVDGAGGADPADVVARQVDEHDVLGPLLGVGPQLGRELGVDLRGRAPGPGTGGRMDHDPGASHRDEGLR